MIAPQENGDKSTTLAPTAGAGNRVTRDIHLASQKGDSRDSHDSRDSRDSRDSITQTEKVGRREVEAAIERSLPNNGEDLRPCMFRFARQLRAIPAIAGKPPGRLRPFASLWAARVADPEWDAETVFYTLAEVWPAVRVAAGENVVDEALKAARAAAPPVCAERYRSERMRLLVGVCYQLQLLAGEQPFFLSAKDAGRVTGASHKTGSLFLRVLVADGILELVERYPWGKRKANRYRFLGARGQ